MTETSNIADEIPLGIVNIYTTEPYKRIVQAYRNRVGACNRDQTQIPKRTLILNKIIDLKSVTREFICHKQITSRNKIVSCSITTIKNHKPEITQNRTILQLYGYEDDLNAIIKKLPLRKSKKFRYSNYYPVDGREDIIHLTEMSKIVLETIKDPIKNTNAYFEKTRKRIVEKRKDIKKSKSAITFDFDNTKIVTD